MPMYEFKPPQAGSLEELSRYIETELFAVYQALAETEAVDLRVTDREPERPRNGMMVFADGTNWNPGNGRSIYVYDDGWLNTRALNNASLSYKTKAALEATNVPSAVSSVRVQGYASVGDGGGAFYKRVSVEPSHAGKIRSADRFLPDGSTDATNGGWWEIASNEIYPQMLGAAGDGTTDDTAALSNADTVADTLSRKLVGFGIYLISSTVSLTAESVDFSAAMIKLANSFPATIGIEFGPGGGALDERHHAILNIDGNRANQAGTVIAVRMTSLASPHVEAHIRGKNCGTVCQLLDNAERLRVWVSGHDSDLVVHDNRAGAGSPDDNRVSISGGDCTQYYVRDGSCITDVTLNVQTQTAGSTVYPVVINGQRHVRLGGTMRSMVNGFVQINQDDQPLTSTVFNDLCLNGDGGNVACVRIEGRTVSGNILLTGAGTGGAVDIRRLTGGGDLRIVNEAMGASGTTTGTGVTLGNTAAATSVTGLNLGLTHSKGAATLALRTENVNRSVVTVLGSAVPIEVAGVLSDFKLVLPAAYVRSNVAVTVTAATVPTIEFVGQATEAQLTAYSTPSRGMRLTQFDDQLETPVYYTGRGATGGWSLPDLSDLNKSGVSAGGRHTDSGTGGKVNFAILHGLSVVPVEISVDAASADARGVFHITADATQIVVTYATAPVAGTNNVSWYWRARS